MMGGFGENSTGQYVIYIYRNIYIYPNFCCEVFATSSATPGGCLHLQDYSQPRGKIWNNHLEAEHGDPQFALVDSELGILHKKEIQVSIFWKIYQLHFFFGSLHISSKQQKNL